VPNQRGEIFNPNPALSPAVASFLANSQPNFSLDTLCQMNTSPTYNKIIPDDVERFLTPAEVAIVLKVSKKWLANAREGRKNIQGPPYIKLGPGRTAPVRYPVNAFKEWCATFV
jgi:hypothetical protein